MSFQPISHSYPVMEFPNGISIMMEHDPEQNLTRLRARYTMSLDMVIVDELMDQMAPTGGAERMVWQALVDQMVENVRRELA